MVVRGCPPRLRGPRGCGCERVSIDDPGGNPSSSTPRHPAQAPRKHRHHYHAGRAHRTGGAAWTRGSIANGFTPICCPCPCQKPAPHPFVDSDGFPWPGRCWRFPVLAPSTARPPGKSPQSRGCWASWPLSAYGERRAPLARDAARSSPGHHPLDTWADGRSWCGLLSSPSRLMFAARGRCRRRRPGWRGRWTQRTRDARLDARTLGIGQALTPARSPPACAAVHARHAPHRSLRVARTRTHQPDRVQSVEQQSRYRTVRDALGGVTGGFILLSFARDVEYIAQGRSPTFHIDQGAAEQTQRRVSNPPATRIPRPVCRTPSRTRPTWTRIRTIPPRATFRVDPSGWARDHDSGIRRCTGDRRRRVHVPPISHGEDLRDPCAWGGNRLRRRHGRPRLPLAWRRTLIPNPVHTPWRQFASVERAVPGSYDLVVQDAVNDLSVPAHLMTKEYNDAVRAVLKPQSGVYLLTHY